MSTALETLLSNLEVDFKTRHRDVRSGWIGVQCPYCGRPGEYYMGIHLQSLATNCWRCGPQKTREVLLLLGATKQALAGLYRNRGEWDGTAPQKQAGTGRYRPPRGIVPLTDAPPLFRRYLKRRGFDPTEIAELWGIQAIPPPHKYNWRLFIPVTSQGKSVSWTTRSISKECPHNLRYLSASPEQESRPLSELLYGLDYCRHSVIIVEGPTDVWAIGPGASGTLGQTLSPSRVAAIARFPVRVIAFDNEPKAQQRAKQLYRRLREMPGRTERYIFSGKDAPDSPRHEIETLRKRYL